MHHDVHDQYRHFTIHAEALHAIGRFNRIESALIQSSGDDLFTSKPSSTVIIYEKSLQALRLIEDFISTPEAEVTSTRKAAE